MSIVFLNGDFIDKENAFVSVMDRGFLFADAVYEVVPIYQKKPFYLKAHLDRLKDSLKAIDIDNPYSENEWFKHINQLISKQPFANQSLYIQVTRGTDTIRKHAPVNSALTATVYMECTPLVALDKNKKNHCLTAEDIRWQRCDIKTTALLANTMYAREAANKKVAEIILCRDNTITEGASSNVFIVKNNQLITHPDGNHILSGITREIVLNLAKKNPNITIDKRVFSRSELYQADEVFISASNREITAIQSVDNKTIGDGEIGAVYRWLDQAYQQLKETSKND